MIYDKNENEITIPKNFFETMRKSAYARTNEDMHKITNLEERIKELKNENSRLEYEILRLKKMTFTQKVKTRMKFALSSCVYKVIRFLEKLTIKIYKLHNNILEEK